ncbi:18069_t:CDS:2 [Funneliformis geosporum]|nr:18069_t:CDS:2 [Funneliformis geosporum]
MSSETAIAPTITGSSQYNANPRPIPDGQSFPSNGIDDDASKLNLNTLSRSDMTMLIPNLFTEKAQFLSTQISMQKEVKAMND